MMDVRLLSTLEETVADIKRAVMTRYEVEHALRNAQRVIVGEMADPNDAIRDLAKAVASLAKALESVLEEREPEHAEASSF
jgi:DNA-directed RNA polymerase subunit L